MPVTLDVSSDGGCGCKHIRPRRRRLAEALRDEVAKTANGRDVSPRPLRTSGSGRASPLSGFLVVVLGLAFGAREDLLGDQAGVLPDRQLDLAGDVGIGLQEG